MARKYPNFYRTQLTGPVLVGDDTISVGTAPPVLASGNYIRLKMYEADENGNVLKSELIDWRSDNTVARGVEGTTPQEFYASDWVEVVITGGGLEKLDGVELLDYFETEHTIPAGSGAVTVSRGNGGMQDFAPSGDVTLTWDLPSGAKQQLLVTPGAHTITWGGDHWMTDVIDTVGKTQVHVVAENWGGTIYLWDGGSRT